MAFEVAPPKYARLVGALQERISAGVYPAGSALPSEHQLAIEFDMSRPTVVRALQILRTDGWIESHQGRGTFVRGVPAVVGGQSRPGNSMMSRDESSDAGELLEVKPVTASPRLARLLDVAPDSGLIRRRWLGLESGEPVELLTTYVSQTLALGTGIDEAAPVPRGVRSALEARRKVRIDHISERITARLPEADEAKALRITRRDPVLALTLIARDATGQPLQLVDAVLPGDRYELEDTYPAS